MEEGTFLFPAGDERNPFWLLIGARHQGCGRSIWTTFHHLRGATTPPTRGAACFTAGSPMLAPAATSEDPNCGAALPSDVEIRAAMRPHIDASRANDILQSPGGETGVEAGHGFYRNWTEAEIAAVRSRFARHLAHLPEAEPSR